MFIFHIYIPCNTHRIEVKSPSLADGRCLSRWIAETYLTPPYVIDSLYLVRNYEHLVRLDSTLYEKFPERLVSYHRAKYTFDNCEINFI